MRYACGFIGLGLLFGAGCVDPYSLGPYSLAAATTSPTELLDQASDLLGGTNQDSLGDINNLDLNNLPSGLSFEDLQNLLNQQDTSAVTGAGLGGS